MNWKFMCMKRTTTNEFLFSFSDFSTFSNQNVISSRFSHPLSSHVFLKNHFGFHTCNVVLKNDRKWSWCSFHSKIHSLSEALFFPHISLNLSFLFTSFTAWCLFSAEYSRYPWCICFWVLLCSSSFFESHNFLHENKLYRISRSSSVSSKTPFNSTFSCLRSSPNVWDKSFFVNLCQSLVLLCVLSSVTDTIGSKLSRISSSELLSSSSVAEFDRLCGRPRYFKCFCAHLLHCASQMNHGVVNIVSTKTDFSHVNSVYLVCHVV